MNDDHDHTSETVAEDDGAEIVPVDYEITITHEKGNWQAAHLAFLLMAAGYNVRKVDRTSGEGREE